MKKITYPLASFGIVLGIWFILGYAIELFPFPQEVAFQLYDFLIQGEEFAGASLIEHTYHSLGRGLIGFGLGSGVGIAVGLVAGWFDAAKKIISPIIYAFQPVPNIVWVPAAVIIVGLRVESILLIVALASFYPVAINAMSGVREADITLLRAAKMLGADNKSIFFRVLLPNSIPQILSGLRVGFANGWRALVAVEMIFGITTVGLGWGIQMGRDAGLAVVFSFVVIIGLIGLVLERVLFRSLEKVTAERWGLTS